MYLALIWLGFGIAAIFLAGIKGFSLSLWGLPCLLLGPAGLMVIAIKKPAGPGSAASTHDMRDNILAGVGAAGCIAITFLLLVTLRISDLTSFFGNGCREFVEIQDEEFWAQKKGMAARVFKQYHVVFVNAEPPADGEYVFSAYPGAKVRIVKKTDNGYFCFDRRTEREGWIRKEYVKRTLFLNDNTLRPCSK